MHRPRPVEPRRWGEETAAATAPSPFLGAKQANWRCTLRSGSQKSQRSGARGLKRQGAAERGPAGRRTASGAWILLLASGADHRRGAGSRSQRQIRQRVTLQAAAPPSSPKPTLLFQKPSPVPFDRRNGTTPRLRPPASAVALAALESGIIIDWQAMVPDSPAAELEVVGSSPPFPPHTLAAARAHADRYDDGGAVEFAHYTDKQLQDFIKQWESKALQDVLARTSDNGKKMRERSSRMKKELERRRVNSNRKVKATKYKEESSDVVLLDDDDDDTEPARSADFEIFNNWETISITSDILIFVNRMDPEAVELAYSDMKCLEPEEYLKSPVINFYLEYLKKSRPRRDLYMFNTYFYSKLENALSTLGNRDSQFSKLRRWCRNVDIFKKSYLILPINETSIPVYHDIIYNGYCIVIMIIRMHWSLIIVCMPTKGADSGPMMLHLDSLGLHNSQNIFDIVARYLFMSFNIITAILEKNGGIYGRILLMIFHFQGRYGSVFREILKGKRLRQEAWNSSYSSFFNVPRQQNEYDCGLFMLYYIDKFIQQAPERLTKESLGMFGRKWFNHEEASQLREGIRTRLFDLFQSAKEDDGPSEPEWQSF
nr:unnamed protein product [Digitaria exilis]